jgi:hypothetical protein
MSTTRLAALKSLEDVDGFTSGLCPGALLLTL